jgi:hypothetical protein
MTRIGAGLNAGELTPRRQIAKVGNAKKFRHMNRENSRRSAEQHECTDTEFFMALLPLAFWCLGVHFVRWF